MCSHAGVPTAHAHAFRGARPLRASRGTRHHHVSCSLNDPWATLGVSRTASEQEVKKAHRKLVLQSHPDLKGDDPLAHARFMRIQEAYELIVGKRQGKDIDGRPSEKSGWQFHDWYWKFSMKRRKGKGPFGAGMDGDEPQPASLRQQWQAQMAGLKQKAAAKRYRQQWQRQGGGAARDPTGAASSHARAARESVWRSTTKNARATRAAAPAQQPAAAAPTLDQGRPVAMAGDSRAQAGAGAAPPGPEEPSHGHAGAPGMEPVHAAAAAHAAAAVQRPSAPAAHGEQVHGGHTASDAAHVPPAGTSHIERLRQLLEHAATLVQPSGKPSQAATSQTHAGGLRVAGRLNLQQLAALLRAHSPGHRASPQEHSAAAAHHSAAPDVASSAVPAGEQLRQRLEASMRRHHVAQEAAAEAASGTAADLSSCSAADEREELRRRYRRYRPSAHAAKFANRDEVEGRLSSQLAGLKRRASLKQEVETSC